jgi:hypothetical protein
MPAMNAPDSPIPPPPEATAPSRSGGVTVIAVFAFLGSLCALLMAVFMAFVPFLTSKSGQHDSAASPALVKGMMFMIALAYLGFAIWGVASSIGLFRLKAWARTSTIVFSVLLILGGGFGALGFLLVSFAMPPNQNAAADVGPVMIFMSVLAAAIAGIGIWWLVYFTRPKVKQQFIPARPLDVLNPETPLSGTRPSAPLQPTRPLSLTIIAWMLLAGCPFLPFSVALHYPAGFFTTVLIGWPAALYYLMFLPAHLFIGIGLLRFKPLARNVGVAYYLFVFANTAVFYLFPGGQARILGLMRSSMLVWGRTQASGPFMLFNYKPFLILGACFGLASLAVPLYFLITRGQAFEAVAAARDRGPEQTLQNGSHPLAQ